MLASALLTTSLSGCAADSYGIGIKIEAAPTAATERRKAEIRQARAPACPTPTQWTAEQRATVADFIDKTASEPGQQLEAPELKRLSNGAQICRTGKP